MAQGSTWVFVKHGKGRAHGARHPPTTGIIRHSTATGIGNAIDVPGRALPGERRTAKYLKQMARPTGFEPMTPRFVVRGQSIT